MELEQVCSASGATKGSSEGGASNARMARFQGASRSPKDFDADHIPAEFKDVMLDIGIAKRPESKPRRIAIKG